MLTNKHLVIKCGSVNQKMLLVLMDLCPGKREALGEDEKTRDIRTSVLIVLNTPDLEQKFQV